MEVPAAGDGPLIAVQLVMELQCKLQLVAANLLSIPFAAAPGSFTAAFSCVASGHMTRCCSAGSVYASHAPPLPQDLLLRCDMAAAAAALRGLAPLRSSSTRCQVALSQAQERKSSATPRMSVLRQHHTCNLGLDPCFMRFDRQLRWAQSRPPRCRAGTNVRLMTVILRA